MNRILYLHGFASGPTSKKARFFQARIPSLEVLDLAQGNFEELTITGQLGVIERIAAGEPVSLIGSSLGGYLAALYGSRHPETQKLVLLAPAFEFNQHWEERIGAAALREWRDTGRLRVFHYSEQREASLGWQFVEDARKYEDYPHGPQPTLIFQGTADTVVPPRYAQEYVRRHPQAKLQLVPSDHELVEALDQIWPAVRDFLGLTPAPGVAET